VAQQDEVSSVRGVVFDTDILVWYLRGEDRARRFIETVAYTDRAVSAVTVMELVQGCRSVAELKAVRLFVARNFSSVIHPGESVSLRAISLLEVYATAHGLRVVDAIIAATALQSGFALATGNFRHYRAIAALHLVRFRL
jgi:predicted nucleic acid-binding protein